MSFPHKPREPRPPSRAKPRTSLKMQAIGFLSRREHSRQELRDKLLASLRKRAREDAALEEASRAQAPLGVQPPAPNGIDVAFAPPGAPPRRGQAPAAHDAGAEPGAVAPEPELVDPDAVVDRLLDWLAANNYLSEARFVESRVHARSRGQGALRIKLELSRHGLALEPDQATTLRETEFARAQALWQRKFGVLASDDRERARQARFLASRGFAADAVRRIVGGQFED